MKSFNFNNKLINNCYLSINGYNQSILRRQE